MHFALRTACGGRLNAAKALSRQKEQAKGVRFYPLPWADRKQPRHNRVELGLRPRKPRWRGSQPGSVTAGPMQAREEWGQVTVRFGLF